MPAEQKITAYKALDENFACRGFQYEVGKTYTHDGKVEICESGFHACLNPLDVLNYYDLTTARFAVVELSGKTATHDEDSKIASAEITIKAELRLPEFIKSAVDFVLDLCKPSKDEGVQAASGDSAQLAASGKNSVIAAASCGAIAKGAAGTWIALAEFNDDGKCIGFATGKVGDDGIEADVFYRAKGGKLVRA